jgi:lantibiotic modifying enzyme
VLFDPASHEHVTERPWDDRRARAVIEAVVTDAESAFDDDLLWPVHRLDEEGGEPLSAVASLYLGASGVIWALHQLERVGAVELRRDWAPVAVRLVDQYSSQPDFQDLVTGPVPSLLCGEAGILLVAHTLAASTWQEERLLEAAQANVANPSWELMWGSPGTMIAARVLYERTGAEHWLETWRMAADRLWAEWRNDLWEQELYGRRGHYLGPAHGFAGNVLALAQGDLLDAARRRELEERAIATLSKYASHDSGLVQWSPALEPPGTPQAIRTQWCHGAPGMVSSLAALAPHDDQLSELLVGGGELTWQAGPLKKGANLCHGTAGNGYAFLKLFERTGDELWLERARAFAMHAGEQVEDARATYGRGRYTLWTGDLGTALYIHDCLAATTAFPTLDQF